MSTVNPKAIDISHYDRVVGDGFNAVKAAGIVGVIQKASEGQFIRDQTYKERVPMIRAAGLLDGAYHFIRPGNAKAQADFFLTCAQPDEHTLLALDYEDNSVSVIMAQEFVVAVEARVGHKMVIYSGNTIKEKLGGQISQFWGARRLWLAQYTNHWTVQRSWSKPWLWQFTGDGAGPPPHTIPGISIAGGLDISSYEGTDEQLKIEWVSDVNTDGPVIIPPSVGSHSVAWVQAAINKLGYPLTLTIDGIMGPKTKAGIQWFQRKANLQPDGIVGPLTQAALDAALKNIPIPVISTGSLIGKTLRYLIAEDANAGLPDAITEVGYDAVTMPKLGIGAKYGNLYDQEGNGEYGPYMAPTETASKYDERVPDPQGKGYLANVTTQVKRAKAQGFTYIELDNPDGYEMPDVLRALDVVQQYGLKSIGKNPGLFGDADAIDYLKHPTVVAVVVEQEAGSPTRMHVLRSRADKPDLPVHFVFFGSEGLRAAHATAGTISDNGLKGMGVTNSPDGEYTSSDTVLLPKQ